VIDKDQFTQRSIRAKRVIDLMGQQPQPRRRNLAGAEVQRHQAGQPIHQAMVGNTRTLSPTVVNEFRFGYNSFFNTFGRESAFVRDVTSELGIPGMASIPPEAWGIPSIGINGLSGFGDSTEGPYTNRNKVFEIIDNVSWIKGRHSFR
jgi:hypothetical protein